MILFPVESDRTPESQFERAVRVRPIRRDLIDEKQIRDVIQSHVFPSVRGFEIRTYESADDAEKCLVVILIPSQHESDKPFLVLSPVGSEGERVQGWLIGMPTRAGDATDHVRPGELHEIILRGRGLAARVDELAAMVAQTTASVEEEETEPAQEGEHDPESGLLARVHRVASRVGGEPMTGEASGFLPKSCSKLALWSERPCPHYSVNLVYAGCLSIRR